MGQNLKPISKVKIRIFAWAGGTTLAVSFFAFGRYFGQPELVDSDSPTGLAAILWILGSAAVGWSSAGASWNGVVAEANDDHGQGSHTPEKFRDRVKLLSQIAKGFGTAGLALLVLTVNYLTFIYREGNIDELGNALIYVFLSLSLLIVSYFYTNRYSNWTL